MRAVIQRVRNASCTVSGKVTGSIAHGLLVYFCAEKDDTEDMLDKFFSKIVSLRIFEDGNGRVARIVSDYVMNRSNEGFPSVFVSSEIKKKQSEYYSILNRISAGSSMDITEWVAWFLERMIDSYVAAIARIQDSFRMKAFWERAREHNLNARQLKFLGKVLDEDWKGAITAKKYAAITECHPDTANRDLRKLVGYGLIVKEEGGSKNTHYSVLIDPC